VPAFVRGADWLVEQAFTRATGAPLVSGNRVRLLKDATANYPAWLQAIRSATRTISFDNYIFDEDEVGLAFADALAGQARTGVKVRVLHDWMGSYGGASRAFWRRLQENGVEVRSFNPPSLASPFGWLSRDHRKMIAIDGRIAFVSGLCVSRKWLGDPKHGGEPWRDTGVEITGPAVAYVERAFARLWGTLGDAIPEGDLSDPNALEEVGPVSLRIVATAPNTARTFRLDQVLALSARKRLWLTDAYFVATTAYLEALRSAARDGVDVRLLLPSASDIPAIRPLSRARYRALLEAGVRIFEWNGPMIHAKTAVADARWARVGSSNLNPASLLGNYELDVAVEDEGFGRELEAMYEADLARSTEIVLARTPSRLRIAPTNKGPKGERLAGRRGSTAAATAGAIRLAGAVGAAVRSRESLAAGEGRIMVALATALLVLGVVAVLWPAVLAWPIALLCVWGAVVLTVRAIKGYRAARRDGSPRRLPQPPPQD
jgi:cardiolipin synthase